MLFCKVTPKTICQLSKFKCHIYAPAAHARIFHVFFEFFLTINTHSFIQALSQHTYLLANHSFTHPPIHVIAYSDPRFSSGSTTLPLYNAHLTTKLLPVSLWVGKYYIRYSMIVKQSDSQRAFGRLDHLAFFINTNA